MECGKKRKLPQIDFFERLSVSEGRKRVKRCEDDVEAVQQLSDKIDRLYKENKAKSAAQDALVSQLISYKTKLLEAEARIEELETERIKSVAFSEAVLKVEAFFGDDGAFTQYLENESESPNEIKPEVETTRKKLRELRDGFKNVEEDLEVLDMKKVVDDILASLQEFAQEGTVEDIESVGSLVELVRATLKETSEIKNTIAELQSILITYIAETRNQVKLAKKHSKQIRSLSTIENDHLIELEERNHIISDRDTTILELQAQINTLKNSKSRDMPIHFTYGPLRSPVVKTLTEKPKRPRTVRSNISSEESNSEEEKENEIEHFTFLSPQPKKPKLVIKPSAKAHTMIRTPSKHTPRPNKSKKGLQLKKFRMPF